MALTATLEHPLDTPADVLSLARAKQRAANAAEAELLEAAVQWCVLHPAESLDEAATWSVFRGFGDKPVCLAGEGAPFVTEFAVVEFAAGLGKSEDAGRAYLAEALELRYRLPKLWAKVTDLDLPAWKARSLARRTLHLPKKGAAFVDTHVAPVASTIGPAALERLLEEALVRFDPDEAQRVATERAEARHVTIQSRQVSFDGHVDVWATLDLADALDLDDALTKGAARLEALGCTDTLDARRSVALGDMARRQMSLEFDTDPKPLVVHVHQRPDGTLDDITRVENTRGFVLTSQLADWCTRAARSTTANTITVKPVIDLNARIHVEAYEVPDRLSTQTRLRDHHCVFPWCTRPAHATSRIDDDHVIPHARGGPTATENIAPLCRRHHRAKTHAGWSQQSPSPGTFQWRSPTGLTYRVDHHGTHDLGPEPPPPQPHEAPVP
ncbi:HNH endonuclease [Nocardioides sp. zg-579]|uniref:HNH endonuclease n=1 Tax=Nocardioides marmotae TaxID=2663857 RepID=A0A6I3J9X1_9ACTN|nr:HNH endonuclease signature motif containing protein [Nocardioides marmotae]MCR6031361.1 HNH endonuclease [Gordonia jinghuaiqii]MTB95000.1 HNH endonuclease [Nocardioides marmotae]QKE02496.1 HNH endonuclease [Nocardioides marmotae]